MNIKNVKVLVVLLGIVLITTALNCQQRRLPKASPSQSAGDLQHTIVPVTPPDTAERPCTAQLADLFSAVPNLATSLDMTDIKTRAIQIAHLSAPEHLVALKLGNSALLVGYSCHTNLTDV